MLGYYYLLFCCSHKALALTVQKYSQIHHVGGGAILECKFGNNRFTFSIALFEKSTRLGFGLLIRVPCLTRHTWHLRAVLQFHPLFLALCTTL